ncbi:uncharacterized protein LOC120348183 [Styela clava]|uniref:uncharacterized protein LOC120347503 n=1 Tax=Styela clava TaxID=7725 RepID=UPI00193992DC|nr:uncharacterized protein LOC120347503 [Styela clava]XP_039274241.1 uncharacterized protein LOC120348183 [Styela clava]
MEFLQALLEFILPFFGFAVVEEVVPVIPEPKPCEGLVECFMEGLEYLAPAGSSSDYMAVLEHIRNDFVLSRVLLLVQIVLMCVVFRKHVAIFVKGLLFCMKMVINELGRMMAFDHIRKSEEEIENLRLLAVNTTKLVDAKLAVLEAKLEMIAEEKKALKEELASFKATVTEHQKEHLDITMRWAKHVEDMMDRNKYLEARRVAAAKRSTGIPLLNSPRPISPRLIGGASTVTVAGTNK